MNPASDVITLCGGARRVADWLGKNPATIHRWRRPRSEGGTDGKIPAQQQDLLLEKARAAGIDLRPEHFFVVVPPLAAPCADCDEERGAA